MNSNNMKLHHLNRVIYGLKHPDDMYTAANSDGTGEHVLVPRWLGDRDESTLAVPSNDDSVHHVLVRVRDQLDAWEVPYTVIWNRAWHRPSVEVIVEPCEDGSTKTNTELVFAVRGGDGNGHYGLMLFDGGRTPDCQLLYEKSATVLADLVVAAMPEILDNWLTARERAPEPAPIRTAIPAALVAIDVSLKDPELFQEVYADVRRRVATYEGLNHVVPTFFDERSGISFDGDAGLKIAGEVVLELPPESDLWRLFLLGRDAFNERFNLAVSAAMKRGVSGADSVDIGMHM
jgi:hypothetical protein